MIEANLSTKCRSNGQTYFQRQRIKGDFPSTTARQHKTHFIRFHRFAPVCLHSSWVRSTNTVRCVSSSSEIAWTLDRNSMDKCNRNSLRLRSEDEFPTLDHNFLPERNAAGRFHRQVYGRLQALQS